MWNLQWYQIFMPCLSNSSRMHKSTVRPTQIKSVQLSIHIYVLYLAITWVSCTMVAPPQFLGSSSRNAYPAEKLSWLPSCSISMVLLCPWPKGTCCSVSRTMHQFSENNCVNWSRMQQVNATAYYTYIHMGHRDIYTTSNVNVHWGHRQTDFAMVQIVL